MSTDAPVQRGGFSAFGGVPNNTEDTTGVKDPQHQPSAATAGSKAPASSISSRDDASGRPPLKYGSTTSATPNDNEYERTDDRPDEDDAPQDATRVEDRRRHVSVNVQPDLVAQQVTHAQPRRQAPTASVKVQCGLAVLLLYTAVVSLPCFIESDKEMLTWGVGCARLAYKVGRRGFGRRLYMSGNDTAPMKVLDFLALLATALPAVTSAECDAAPFWSLHAAAAPYAFVVIVGVSELFERHYARERRGPFLV